MIELERLRAGGPSCPSDLRIDRRAAEESSPDETEQIDLHVAECETCKARLAERRAGFAAFPEANPAKMLAAITRPKVLSAPQRSPWKSRAAVLGAPLLAAAAVLVMMKRTPPTEVDTGTPPTTRLKGGAVLHVYRLDKDARVDEVVSGAHVAPGDRLRFAVDLAAAGQTLVIGVEANGSLYRAWPMNAETNTALPAGQKQELPGAVALDSSTGRETLYLVHCPGAKAAPECTMQSGVPKCSQDCALSPFILEKSR